jgi:hypothetical protein
MIDPDVLLSRIRRSARQWDNELVGSTGEAAASADVMEALGQLDTHLSEGGTLPAEWAAGRNKVLIETISARNAEIGELKAKVARLEKAYIEASNPGLTVLYAPESQCIKILLGEAEHGHETECLMRATDTGKSWRLANGVWSREEVTA